MKRRPHKQEQIVSMQPGKRAAGSASILRQPTKPAAIVVVLLAGLLLPAAATAQLVVDPDNPRYFKDSSTGKTVYLTGSHTWWNIQDIDTVYPPFAFDYDEHIAWLKRLGHNHTRLWHFESVYWYKGGKTKTFVYDHPYRRTGPGNADDGRPRFDVTKLNQAYFDRLRSRVIKARDNGIYVAVMFFQGIAATDRAVEWAGHPFNAKNNINGISGDLNNNGAGSEVHTLRSSAIVAAQRLYIRKTIDTLNDLDNVLWEIGNEIYPGKDQVEWAYDTIDYIKQYESLKPKQHPVGLSHMHSYNDGGKWTRAAPSVLFNSPADWVSVGSKVSVGWDDYKYDPPAATGAKVIVSDSDHMWGVIPDSESTANAIQWVWKSALMAIHLIAMQIVPADYPAAAPWLPGYSKNRVPVRNAMRYSRAFLDRFDLGPMRPRSDLSSLKHCLAEAGQQYLVYKPASNRNAFTVSGLIPNDRYEYEWFDTAKNVSRGTGTVVPTSRRRLFTPPSTYALLYLKNIEGDTVPTRRPVPIR